jgi:hypothetical protein
MDLLVTIDSEGPVPGRLLRPADEGGRPAQVDPASFTRFAQAHAQQPVYERVSFVGDGEALEQHGFGLVAAARESGFAHVRLVTSPRRLTEARQVRAVVMAGVGEFCVGLHGDSSELHDGLTKRPGEFAKIQTCLDRLAKHEVRVLVDVVLTTANLEAVPRIIELAVAKGAHAITLSSHCPAGSEPGSRELIPTLDTLLPVLEAAIASCRAAGVEVGVRHVPACLLGEHLGLLDNSLPDALDGVRPGRPLPQFNCLLEAKCEHAERCLGLHHAYVNAHGWELERLRPVPRVRPWRERERSVERSTGGATGPRGHAAWLALLGEHAGRVEGISLTRTEARYPMQMPDGTRFILVLTARDDAAKSFIQSRSFNLAYTDVEGPAEELAIAGFIEPVLATIAANDDGSLSLDAKA